MLVWTEAAFVNIYTHQHIMLLNTVVFILRYTVREVFFFLLVFSIYKTILVSLFQLPLLVILTKFLYILPKYM